LGAGGGVEKDEEGETVHRNLMVISVWMFGEGGTGNLGRVCVRTAGALQAEVHCWVRYLV
jgi:hypothetical protein